VGEYEVTWTHQNAGKSGGGGLLFRDKRYPFNQSEIMRGLRMVLEMEMVLMWMLMLMERSPHTPRRIGDDNDFDFSLSGCLGAGGYALSRSRRGLLPALPPL
jgi:hypothetical protein